MKFIDEIKLMNKISDHPNIIKFIGIYENEENNNLYLMMEFMKDESLKSFLEINIIANISLFQILFKFVNKLQVE